MMQAKCLLGKAAFTVAFLATVTPVIAADAEGRYAVEGPATQKCSAFIALEPTSRDYLITAGYISGYLGASNALAPDTFDLTPWQTLELSVLQIRQFCESNPEATLAAGLAQYTTFLMPARLKANEEKTSLRVGDKVVVQYQSVVDHIRNALAEMGFGSDGEPLDGLKDFQVSVGLEATGLPDQATLTRLFSQVR